MQEGFKKFKKKIYLEVSLKSIAFGLSMAMLAFGIPLLLNKIKDISWQPIFYVLLGIGALIIFTGLCFLVLRPSNQKIAKRLDTNWHLNEKVQTMLEYEAKEGIIVNLQREDTNSRLLAFSLRSLTTRISMFLLILFILATGLCVTAFAYPTQPDLPTEPTTPPVTPTDSYQADDWTMLALKQLIAEVNAANIVEEAKIKYVEELYKLMDGIVDTTVELKNELVNTTIKQVFYYLEITNTVDEIYDVLSKSSKQIISTLAKRLNEFRTDEIAATLDTIRENVVPTDGFILEQLMLNINELHNQFGKLLDKEIGKKLKVTDSLTKTLLDFSFTMSGNADSTKYGDVSLKLNTEADLIKIFDTYEVLIINETTKQKENDRIAKHIEKRLKEIFALEADENPDQTKPNETETSPEITLPTLPTVDLPTGGDGGIGPDKHIYPSNDPFFDPEGGSKVYGEYFIEYRADIDEKFADKVIPEEYLNYFKEYFDALYE